jgi:hypothetical protein
MALLRMRSVTRYRRIVAYVSCIGWLMATLARSMRGGGLAVVFGCSFLPIG